MQDDKRAQHVIQNGMVETVDYQMNNNISLRAGEMLNRF